MYETQPTTMPHMVGHNLRLSNEPIVGMNYTLIFFLSSETLEGNKLTMTINSLEKGNPKLLIKMKWLAVLFHGKPNSSILS